MLTYIIIALICFAIFYVWKNHINIDFKSFFKKGFLKNDNYFGLYCYTGKQGTGKTYSAINFLIKNKFVENYTIITNVKSFNVFSDTIYLSNINDIIDYVLLHYNDKKKYIIFFDEIFTILEKRTAINKKILSFISQLRKRKLILITTAQEWSEINITFRRYVRFQISCNMLSFPILKFAYLINKVNDGDEIRWSNDLQDFVAPTISTNIMKGRLDVIQSYDTFETIDVS